MNKKICSLICFMLILGAIIPVTFAGRPDKGTLEKIEILIIHRSNRYRDARPDGVGNDKPGDEEGYYTLLKKGVKWPDSEIPVTYYIDFSSTDFEDTGLDEVSVRTAIIASAETWDDSTSADLFFFGGTCEVIGSWDAMDEKNVFVFGDYDREGVIAVASIWGIFGGPPSGRRIVEFDIMFDTTDFDWGTDDIYISDVMDIQNIATHELGHGAGLGDLYTDAASEETMYGYSYYGDTTKRTLYFGDIAGIQELYG